MHRKPSHVQPSNMPAKKKPATKKPAKKNPTDPNLLGRSVIEAFLGEPVTNAEPKKRDSPKKQSS